MEFDINADVIWRAAGEQLGLLEWRKTIGMRQPALERFLVRGHGRREWQTRQIGQVVGLERGTKALLTQALELLPLGFAGVTFENVVPLLGSSGEME